MNYFYLIDKPSSITSFDIIRKLRKITGVRKMGHTGTLDPLATGLVLVAIGNYTKLIPYLEKDRKEYEFTIGLDGTTESFDSETPVNYISEEKKDYYSKKITKNYIKDILNKHFNGEISQLPPKYSALKVGGKKALDLVRKGIDFELKKRKVIIKSISFKKLSYPSLYLKAEVSAGTYIRSIASDLGKIIGSGGYIKKLRRTKIGELDISFSQKLDNFNKDNYLKENYIFRENKFINLEESHLKKINNGLQIKGDFPFEKGQDLFVKNKDSITNIVRFDGEYLKAIRKI